MRVFHVIAAALVAVGMSSNAHARSALVASPACDLTPAAGVAQQLSSGGRQRTYRLFVPQGFEGRAPLPLVLGLHGSGRTAADQARTSRFETLAARFDIRDRAVLRIAEIVHDLDLKDGKFGAPEAATVGIAIDGMQLSSMDDNVLLEQGMTLFEALYRSFGQSIRPSRPRAVATSKSQRTRQK